MTPTLLNQEQGATRLSEQENGERRQRARKPLSGSCGGGYLTATTVKEKPRRHPTGPWSLAAPGCDERGPCPPVCTHDPLNDLRVTPDRFGTPVRKSLSGSCEGGYPTATTVKEKPRRHPTGTRLLAAPGCDERGPCLPVCAHDPLNDLRTPASEAWMRWSQGTPVPARWGDFRASTHNIAPPRRRRRVGAATGTLRRSAAF